MRRLPTVLPIYPTLRILLPLLLLICAAPHALQAEQSDMITPELELALRHLCEDVPQGHLPEQAHMATLIRAVRATIPTDHADQPRRVTSYAGAPGAYYGFHVAQPLRQYLRYLYNPLIPQGVIKPFSLRSSVWLTADTNTAQSQLWADPWPPENMRLLRGTQEDRTTPDPSTGGCYTMRLNRVLIFSPLEQAFISISVQIEPSSIGTKGYSIGNEAESTFVYSLEERLTKTGLGWVDSRVQTNISVAVYLPLEDGGVWNGVFQWMRAGWSGLSVVRSAHIQDSLHRYAQSLRAVLRHAPSPDILEKSASQVHSLPADEVERQTAALLASWREAALRNNTTHALRLLDAGYLQQLELPERQALILRAWHGL